jgi:phosphatidylglycerophosphatase A
MLIKICNRDILRRLDFKHPATWLATWGGTGLIQPAPGTWGTLGALPFGIAILMFGGIYHLLVATLIVFILGLWSAKHFERMVREKDSGMIVIDEVVGMWITLIPAVLTPISIGIAFILFRLFDIIKPWPIGWMDKKINGAMGVMLDDVMAGIYAALALMGLHYANIV